MAVKEGVAAVCTRSRSRYCAREIRNLYYTRRPPSLYPFHFYEMIFTLVILALFHFPGRTVATVYKKPIIILSILIAADTLPVIGFTQRNQTISESDHEFQNDSMEFIISVPIMTTETFEIVRSITCRYQKSTSNAVVVNHPGFDKYYDVIFGVFALEDTNGLLEEWLLLQPGENFTEMQVTIRDDLLPESQECFTIVIMTVVYGVELFTCNDSEDATNYFCSHTICIDDNDCKLSL